MKDKQITSYYIVTVISKSKSLCNYFYENFPKTLKVWNYDNHYHKLTFKVDKIGTWQNTKEYINKAKNAYNDIMVNITEIEKPLWMVI